MFYDFAITIEANTTEAEAKETRLELTWGIIHRIEVQFPIGTQALAHCRLLHRRAQKWPTNIDGSFASDGYVIPIDEHFDLTEPPHELTAICWNDDDTYPHTITIRIGILPPEVLTPLTGIGAMLKKFLKLVGIRG